MTMQSSSLLPALRELPGDDSEHRSFRDHIADLVNMDRAMYAAEFASAASFGLWYIFDDINVDDGVRETMTRAHQMAASDYNGTLTDHWREMMERGPESREGFIILMKGKAAEIKAEDILEQNGFTNVEIAENPNQPIWDISAIDPDGQEVLIQVKTGAAERAGEVQALIEENPDIHYAVSSEIYDRISESVPDVVDRMTNIGSDYVLETGIEDGLDTLRSNMGIDIPDGVADIIPYAGAIIAGARLIYSVIQTEKKFKTVDRTAKNKIQVVQTLTLMSRMGITAVLSAAGGAAGSIVPGVGNLVGVAAGAGMGMYLNRHLEPHMLELALDITGLTNDDLFYYKNKPRIDKAARSFRKRAAALPSPA